MDSIRQLCQSLLHRRLTRDVFAIVDLQSKPGDSPEHMEDILCSVESVKGCLRATSDMSIYLQIVDVLSRMRPVRLERSTRLLFRNVRKSAGET